MSETTDEFKAVLALQTEIDQKLDQLLPRIKALVDKYRGKGQMAVEIDNQLYQLVKVSTMMQMSDSCRKHDGFFCDYRLVKVEQVQ